ncbi:MAG: hypothetical protein KDI06_21700, partial [Calditrichaeota bacterium]|nr:hypothetical protein [Calditrichota bacterium]
MKCAAAGFFNTFLRRLGLLLVLGYSLPLPGQQLPVQHFHPEAGLFPHTQVKNADIGAHPQTWQFLQDDKGFIYAANGAGLLIYDGAAWRIVTKQGYHHLRSISLGKADTVYTGFWNDIGFFAPDSAGKMHFQSLLQELPEDYRAFSDIWQTLATESGVYYMASEYLFRWQNGQMKTWTKKANRDFLVHTGDSVYLFTLGDGIRRIDEDSLRTVPGGEFFAENLVLDASFDAAHNLRILTAEKGPVEVAFSDSGTVRVSEPLPVFATIFPGLNIFRATWLSNGNMALATLGNGVLIVSREGEILYRIDKQYDFISEMALTVFEERHGGLWIAVDSGILFVDIQSPFTFYERRNGLRNPPTATIRHGKDLYVSTIMDIFRVEQQADGQAPEFVKISDDPVFIWQFLEKDGRLFAVEEEGLKEVVGDSIVDVGIRNRIFRLSNSTLDTSYAYLSRTYGGLLLFRYEDKNWREIGSISGIDRMIQTTIERPGKGENAPDTLWCKSFDNKLYAICNPLDSTRREIRYFSENNGLKEWNTFVPFEYEGKLYFLADDQILKYAPLQNPEQPFVADPLLRKSIFPEGGVLTEWNVLTPNIALVADKDHYQFLHLYHNGPFDRIRRGLGRIDKHGVEGLFSEREDLFWLAEMDYLYRYDLSKNPVRYSAKTAIRLISDMISGDTLFYGYQTRPLGSEPLPFVRNSLRIEFATPFYGESKAVEHRTRLRGNDQNWSRWSTATYKEINNLREGQYAFEVQARNSDGELSRIATLGFEILPPWYRAWWAYLTLAATLLLMMITFAHWRVRSMRRHNRELEQLVGERTAVISEQNATLEVVNEDLQKAKTAAERERRRAEEATQAKSEFLANMSHEIRTPM